MTAATLNSKVRRGFLLSLMSNAMLRFGTLLTGILLARILAPEDFGVFAIALTVQTILMTMSELGMASDLVRHGNIDERGPTVATISLFSSGALTAAMWFGAEPLASALGGPAAAPVIQVMSLTVLLAGIGVVPYARLQRELMQGKLFINDAVSFVVTTGVTVTLALDGHGPMSIAIARVAAQTIATTMQFLWTGHRPRFGWDREVAGTALRFGFPLACAGLLAWALLTLDNVMVGRLSGPEILGFYVLAFNISSWPATVIGTAVRAVAMPAFAQRADDLGKPDANGLIEATALTWAAAMPIGFCLAVLAGPTIEVVYGARWLPGASALAWLGMFGALRVVFDLWVAYLTAGGRSKSLLWTQIAWIITLGPVMYVGITQSGLNGAGWSHLVVAAGLMLPVYLNALRRIEIPVRALINVMIVPLLAAIPAVLAGKLLCQVVDRPWLQVGLGGLLMVGTYSLFLWPWFRRRPILAKRLNRVHVSQVQTIDELGAT